MPPSSDIQMMNRIADPGMKFVHDPDVTAEAASSSPRV
jgi:hypothetical protein